MNDMLHLNVHDDIWPYVGFPPELRAVGFKIIDTEVISTRSSLSSTVNVTYTANAKNNDFGEFSITVDSSQKAAITIKVSGINQEDDLVEEESRIEDPNLIERFTKNVDWEAVTNWVVVNMAKCIALML
ncbi:MAG: hypothetical protein ACRBFS_19560 [Aureispira sp.]